MSKSDKEDDDEGKEILVDLRHDPFLRHVVLSIHMGKSSKPREYLEELRAVVEEYWDKPEELFEQGGELEDFH